MFKRSKSSIRNERNHPELGERTLEIRYYPLKKNEEIKGVVSVLRDITERRNHEEREEFLHSLLRHDLRNKIQLIQGYQQLLEEQNLPKEAEEYIQKTQKTAKTSKDIINKVRTLRKAQEETTKEVNIEKIVHKAVKQTQEIVEQNNIQTTLTCPKTCTVKGGTLLTQVFTNIIENAAQHSQGNKIKIHGKTTENKVTCIIEDNGKGIPDDKKEEIFNKGYTTDKERGTELGLYLAKTLIQIYNGKIKVENSELGGTKFTIKLKKYQNNTKQQNNKTKN